jgi:hypothetical protein
MVIALATAGVANAASPVPTSIRIVGNTHGFLPVAERLTRHRTVVDTFRGSLGTVKMVGLPGSTISFEVVPPDATGHGSIRVHMGTAAPKSASVGTSQAQNLADLGVSPAVSAMATPGGGTPWASTCVNINVLGGAVQGSGCNNVYKKHVSGTDWYLANEYWASASLTAWQGPLGLHLQGVAFETTWHPGNTIYSIAPSTTTSFGSCAQWTISLSGAENGITIGGSITGQICPSALGPWNLRLGSTYPNSGAIWTGNVQGVSNYQGMEGVQLVHNPPGVAASWDDYYSINYCNGVCF